VAEDAADYHIEPVRRLKVADAVAAQLSRLIDGGEFQPGQKLPAERLLAERFGVGRSSMREAFRSLESQGLVRVEHGIGVIVLDREQRAQSANTTMLVIGAYTVPELFEIRLPLERDAAGLAAKRIGPQETAELHAILAKAEDPALSDEQYIELDAELHMAIARATKNSLFASVMTGLRPCFFQYSQQVLQLPERRKRAQEGHRRIVDAVVAGRVKEARAAAVAHIRDVEEDLVEYLAAEDRRPED
jgi:GntR family transcriptional regulator, transcriptional repressor for pyruvate dehydrogenase complex